MFNNLLRKSMTVVSVSLFLVLLLVRIFLFLRHYTSLRRSAGTYCPSVVKLPYLCSVTFCFDFSVENDTLNCNRYIFCIGQ
jgi:hypothetical protein